MNYALKRLMATGQPPDNFDYKRGFLAGAMEVVRHPGEAVKALEKAHKQEASTDGP